MLKVKIIYNGFYQSCQGTEPRAITVFLESDNCEDAIRNAISLGGNSDTLAYITGCIAEVFHGKLPADFAETAIDILDENLR